MKAVLNGVYLIIIIMNYSVIDDEGYTVVILLLSCYEAVALNPNIVTLHILYLLVS
jgi:hypothetical protein